MSRSNKKFSRWSSITKSTWSFQVFNKYNDELNMMLYSYTASKRSTYKSLKANGATWEDKASKHLNFDVPNGEEAFSDLKDWSCSFNSFHNWMNLNALMAINSNLETYLSTSISLALESDPGVLFNSPKSIDGVVLLKKGSTKGYFNDKIIETITKGDWSSRTTAFKRTFGVIPPEINNYISELEKIRKIRNKVGHAFGRDIRSSRNHEVKDILLMKPLRDERLKRYHKIIWESAKSIDNYLLHNHIGEFQAISFYHRMYDGLRKDLHQSMRAIELKKRLGSFGDTSGKEFCKGLVKYYEAL